MSPLLDHTMEEEPGRIRYQAVERGSSPQPDVYVEWRGPNLWILSIATGFKNVVAFAPVNDGKTRMHLHADQSFVRVPVLKDIVNAVTRITNRRVLVQDQRVVEAQTPKITTLRSDEVLVSFDRPIIAFRRQRETWSGPARTAESEQDRPTVLRSRAI